eukprot:CAMPEP_0179163390 /NCGR_PEP_ID=MMETSP0796-20121207/80109_1 /TAXON_ID=73915 /ORGANISM="Pyrodinium bahamense, Strain pbaha01" /LENGTH=150 /DNA_ID=CAMNT_0020865707 /DNA_START=586 /DNA_END=1036 /DNA_ORIENTATION=+
MASVLGLACCCRDEDPAVTATEQAERKKALLIRTLSLVGGPPIFSVQAWGSPCEVWHIWSAAYPQHRSPPPGRPSQPGPPQVPHCFGQHTDWVRSRIPVVHLGACLCSRSAGSGVGLEASLTAPWPSAYTHGGSPAEVRQARCAAEPPQQ